MNAKKFFRRRVDRTPKSPAEGEPSARGISSYLQSPYSPWVPFTTATKSDSDQDAMYSYQMGYMNQPFDGREELLIDRQNNGYKAQESYGGYEDGGYGAMQNSVAFSALGFMCFLFFLKMIGDTLNILDGGLPLVVNKKRDSRSAASVSSSTDEMSGIGKLDWATTSLITGLILDDPTELCQNTQQLCKVNKQAKAISGNKLRETFAKQFQRSDTSKQNMKATSDVQPKKTCHPYLKTCHEKDETE